MQKTIHTQMSYAASPHVWFNGMESESKTSWRESMLYRTGKMLLTAVISVLIALGASTALGVTITEDWVPDEIEDESGWFFRYPVAITCSERNEDSWAKLNNGCSVKIGKTNAKGVTKFTFTYADTQGRKQKVSWSGRDQMENTFEANGHVYEFVWDAIPYGMWLYVDSIYDADGQWLGCSAIHFYLIDTKSSGDVVVPVEWQKARTLNGLYGEGCDGSAAGADGTAQLKCGKANKQGIAKVSLSITPFNGKKRSYKSVSVDVSQGGAVEVSWPQQKYQVSIWNDEFFGEPIYDDWRPACSPNAVWSADVGGSFTKTAYFNFGWIAEAGMWDEWWFVMTYLDGVGYVVDGTYVYVDGTDVYNPVKVSMNGGKWTCPKAARLSTHQICSHSLQSNVCYWEWGIGEKTDLSNVPALKLSYNAKTGIFKGSFNIYGVRKKKYTAKVTGVVVNGFGYGQASCPKISSDPWAVTVR